MIKKILIINGPNLNLLGEREQSQYGQNTLEEIKDKCMKLSKDLNSEIDFFQSNIEGKIVDKIQ